MKIICDQQALSKALNIVSKGVTNRTTIPILKGILLETLDQNTLKLTASDFDITIETKIEIKADETGSIVVFSKLFTDIIRKMPSGELTLEVEENNNINIKGQNSEFDIIGLSADEFPNINETEESYKIYIDRDIFKDMIKKTSFSVSLEETRGLLTGVLIDLKQNQLMMVALDGFRIATVKTEIEYDNEDKKFVISGKIINEISKILTEDEDQNVLQIAIENKKVIIITEKIKITVRLMEGEYINYENIFPREKKCTIKVSREDLQESIERASLLAKEGKNNLIKFLIEDNKLTITSRSDEGKVKEEIVIEKEGSDIEIGFNSKYVMDVLKALTSEEDIVMEFNANVNPCLIKPAEGEQFKYMILPVRITS